MSAPSSTNGRFVGWSADAPAFLADLEANNTKDWWLQNRERYDHHVLAPMRLLAEAVEGEFGVMSIKRPHRDVRFSADKSPYKTTIAGSIDAPGGMLFGVQLSATVLSVVAGHFELAPDQLTRFRAAMMNESQGADFEQRIETLARKQLALESFSSLKGAPRGFPKDHPRVRFLAMKGLHVGRSWSANKLPAGPKVIAAIVGVWRDAAPLMEFLAQHVGPSALGSFGRPK
jgi:uncharacterized protein (TIGR02453 family)